jgi:trehalose-phosphatase
VLSNQRLNDGGVRDSISVQEDSAGASALAEVISEVVRRVRPDRRISLFLDFDGTLVPIAPDPATPQLDAGTYETLKRISSREFCVSTIISGRAIADLYSRIRLDGLIYAGNHGLEIRGRDLDFVEPSAVAAREKLAKLTGDLSITLRPVAGVYVEYKGLTTSVHYRQAGQHDVVRVEGAVRGAVARQAGRFRVNAGKKVFEIVPRTNWHKGAAAQWINRRLCLDEQLSIYFGDDTTDEDAFSSLPQAITVAVGEMGSTSARYQLPGPEAVHEFLEWMADFEPRWNGISPHDRQGL